MHIDEEEILSIIAIVGKVNVWSTNFLLDCVHHIPLTNICVEAQVSSLFTSEGQIIWVVGTPSLWDQHVNAPDRVSPLSPSHCNETCELPPIAFRNASADMYPPTESDNIVGEP